MRKESNLHCDGHVAAVNKRTLPPFALLDSFWIMRSQRSRHRDKAFIATSGSLATQTEPICVRFQGQSVTKQITFLKRKSALIYTSKSY